MAIKAREYSDWRIKQQSDRDRDREREITFGSFEDLSEFIPYEHITFLHSVRQSEQMRQEGDVL